MQYEHPPYSVDCPTLIHEDKNPLENRKKSPEKNVRAADESLIVFMNTVDPSHFQGWIFHPHPFRRQILIGMNTYDPTHFQD